MPVTNSLIAPVNIPGLCRAESAAVRTSCCIASCGHSNGSQPWDSVRTCRGLVGADLMASCCSGASISYASRQRAPQLPLAPGLPPPAQLRARLRRPGQPAGLRLPRRARQRARLVAPDPHRARHAPPFLRALARQQGYAGHECPLPVPGLREDGSARANTNQQQARHGTGWRNNRA